MSLVARPPGGEAVSGYACNPRRALACGDEATLATIGETGDVMTHPDWRRRGVFGELDRRAMEEVHRRGWVLAFGLPNRRSAHIFLKLGWELVGEIRPWTFVLRADRRAFAAERTEGRARQLALPASAVRCRRARRPELLAELAVERLERFPETVAELSRAVELRFPLMVRRDPAYLDWRFLRAPNGLHEAYALRRAEGSGGAGELAAYVVVQRPREDGVGWLVDLLAPREEDAAAAVEAGLARLAEAGAAVVRAHAVDGSWWSALLARSGFLRPHEENHLTVIAHVHDSSHPLAAAARDAATWYLTDGDRDDETVG